MKAKKLMAMLLAACLGITLLAGCGDDKKSNGDATTPAEDGGQEENADDASDETPEEPENFAGTQINLMASQNWIKDVDNELFDKFKEETGIEVKVTLTPDNEYETLLGTTLSGGSDAVDVFMYSAGAPMRTAGIPDVAVDLSGEPWVSNLENWAVEANSSDGTLYGFSTWGVDYEGVLYNKTYFEENNLTVPTTWDEFVALCDEILGLGMMPLYEGINGTWHTQTWVYAMTDLMRQENPDYIEYLNSSKDNKYADFQCLKDGLTQLQEFLSAKEGNEPKYFTNDGQAEDWFGSYTALQNREVAMMVTYTAYPAELAANGATDEFGMFPIPLLDNQTTIANGGGISKFINKNSKNIDACKQFLEFLARDENLETYYAGRSDLVTASFKDVESVSATTATTEILERTQNEPPTMIMKDVLYWDPDMYKYLQGMAEGTTTAEDFIASMDAYRELMFDTAAE